MSVIPKISVGLASGKRQKLNLSFDNSTTSNIGCIQPTMCREMVPNAKFSVKVSSLVRLASMPLPTFGRMSLRHYHVFVPYQDVWEPFNAMMSGQHYSAGGSTWIPSSVPTFTVDSLLWLFTNYSDISIAATSDLGNPLQITIDNVAKRDGKVFEYGSGQTYETYADAVKAAQAYDLEYVRNVWNLVRQGSGIFGGKTQMLFSERPSVNSDPTQPDGYGLLNLGPMAARISGLNAGTDLTISYGGTSGNVLYSGGTPITVEGADLISQVGSYSILFKFRPELKRLRTIFIGLGYSFSPYNNSEKYSVLKLLAYYKAWYNLFSPRREQSFVDTVCYRLIKQHSTANLTIVENSNLWKPFLINLLTDCYYYLPMDYFSMSVLRPSQGNQDNTTILSSGASYVVSNSGAGNDPVTDQVTAENTGNGLHVKYGAVHLSTSGSHLNPMTLKLAFQMLKWANKNTVLGRSVREYLKVHFGITDVDDHEADTVQVIGSSRTNIQISDVMSTAESEQGYLGEYGGRGIGYGDSETFDYTAKNFGVWLTLTTIVPESGYYQGYMKENRHQTRFDFFNPEFDALGYQVLERGEVMNDYNCDGQSWNPTEDYKRLLAFGFVPRYSEYKVGRNIVNGDLSLAGLLPSMGPYTLDRRFAGGMYYGGTVDGNGTPATKILKPSYVPSIVHDSFRRIDPTDHLGQYNRIFNYGGNDLDHFIIHNLFDVKCYAPMKALSNSFDTVDDGESTVGIQHS